MKTRGGLNQSRRALTTELEQDGGASLFKTTSTIAVSKTKGTCDAWPGCRV